MKSRSILLITLVILTSCNNNQDIELLGELEAMVISDTTIYKEFEVDIQPLFGKRSNDIFLNVKEKFRLQECRKTTTRALFLSCVVEKNGDLSTINSVKEQDSCLVNKAIEFLDKMPPWSPGMIGDQAVRTQYYIIFPIFNHQ